MTGHYRWLEGDEKGRLTDRVRGWTDKQNAHTRSVLDRLPGRAAVETRLGALMRLGSISAPVMAGTRYFYRERRGDQKQSVLYVRERHDGAPRRLIDPNTLDSKAWSRSTGSVPGPGGQAVAFGISRAGDEKSTLHVLDVDSGQVAGRRDPRQDLPHPLDARRRRLLLQSTRRQQRRLLAPHRYHRIGRHRRQDPILVRQRGTKWARSRSSAATRAGWSSVATPAPPATTCGSSISTAGSAAAS